MRTVLAIAAGLLFAQPAAAFTLAEQYAADDARYSGLPRKLTPEECAAAEAAGWPAPYKDAWLDCPISEKEIATIKGQERADEDQRRFRAAITREIEDGKLCREWAATVPPRPGEVANDAVRVLACMQRLGHEVVP